MWFKRSTNLREGSFELVPFARVGGNVLQSFFTKNNECERHLAAIIIRDPNHASIRDGRM
jgi:hypothetical protein